MASSLISLLIVALMLVGLPLLGVGLAGQPLAPYLEFPPLTRSVAHAPFSWPVFTILTVLVIAAVTPFVIRILRASKPAASKPARSRPLPWWGWLGLALTALAWTLAWTRFSMFEALQEFTFTPVWLGYILTVNALTYMRTGQCMLLNRTGYFFSLFALSAAFWWFFEYLNRFVQNWYYVGISDFGPGKYFIFASLPFSTVLPAVVGTKEWLAGFPRLSAGLDQWVAIPVRYPKAVAVTVLVIAAAALTGIGIWPDYVFSLLWVAPLLVITSLQVINGRATIFSGIGQGDWRSIWLFAVAALVSGFFWEMWNFKSLAKWEYAVPFVHRFQVFEMPLLGYAGYLAFGLECAVVADLLDRKRESG